MVIMSRYMRTKFNHLEIFHYYVVCLMVSFNDLLPNFFVSRKLCVVQDQIERPINVFNSFYFCNSNFVTRVQFVTNQSSVFIMFDAIASDSYVLCSSNWQIFIRSYQMVILLQIRILFESLLFQLFPVAVDINVLPVHCGQATKVFLDNLLC